MWALPTWVQVTDLPMIVIACLGNPGKKYQKNRHNTGYIIGAHLLEDAGIDKTKNEPLYHFGKGKILDTDACIIFPKTFMNESGKSVRDALRRCSESPENLIAVHDEIELEFGVIKHKFGGGHKGHNGIRSITQELGTADFHRVRIGVGRPDNPHVTVADYLLSNFLAEELVKIHELAPRAIGEIKSIIGGQAG